MHIHLDNFRGEADLVEIKSFLTGRERWISLPDYWAAGKSTVGTFQAMFDSPPSHHRFLRDACGVIQAYLWLCPAPLDTVDGDGYSWRILVHPGQRSRELILQLLIHAEAQLPLLPGAESGKPIRTVCYGEDFWLASLLEEFGYVKENPQEVYMQRALEQPIKTSVVARGYSLRPFNPDTDLLQRSGVQSDAFAGLVEPNEWSIANTKRFIRWYEGRQDLDLVAVTPTGEIASFALFLVDPVTLVGELDPVGTRGTHQRKGLSKAILLSGLEYLRINGMKRAVVRTSIDNHVAIRTYESVGFCVVDKLYGYVKAGCSSSH